MKNLLKITLALLTLTLALSCSSQNNTSSANINSLLQSNEFTFVAERASPNNAEVINILNSLPNGLRMLNLDPGYTIEIRKGELNVTLPYFGRMYTPNLDPSKNSYRFSSKDFTVNRKDGKKGSVIFTIIANDQQNKATITMQVFQNGKSYVFMDSNDRQPISYDGYITANTPAKN
ncbi:DUF4251 domain-containing protein [Chryseobacterium gotjawalense]|uniref:DUF4251 domain-containing protein n=1 Tax=Chryseobacterium gotjawalense TaxID=3042315 RepID=A0ABY8R9L8_9FLAO|nr:DUF4251 domain-containing protein [Chryseobacterium sp. wdc7]WHF50625.1 DUF4251 domain-containing protein [Chryseobacterium sp. wdc7]